MGWTEVEAGVGAGGGGSRGEDGDDSNSRLRIVLSATKCAVLSGSKSAFES
jgi:hypothetical protein